jgi:hypothetical protein
MMTNPTTNESEQAILDTLDDSASPQWCCYNVQDNLSQISSCGMTINPAEATICPLCNKQIAIVRKVKI